MKKVLWVVDPIPYLGGSKVASESLLKEIEGSGGQVRVFSRDADFWKNSGFDCCKLYNISILERRDSGYLYFFTHFLIAVQVWLRLAFIKKQGRLMGISGPGVDVSVYWLSRVFSLDVVQVIHGPVAQSKTNINSLLTAKIIACLDCEYSSVIGILEKNGKSPEGTVSRFINGISTSNWPLKTKSNFSTPSFFWAASLLKWKRVELFIDAFLAIDPKGTRATLCYIKPKSTCLEVSDIPLRASNLLVFDQPVNLDELRSSANLFVSTSIGEPFGLSILEAMAAGLCVVIPEDGAYWDQVLTHKVNCIKYNPHSKKSLINTFCWLQNNMNIVERTAANGVEISKKYRAEVQFKHIVKAVLGEAV